MSANILEVAGLNKHFGGLHVTCDVNFVMEEGEQSAIIGPNGAGKSTFMNLLTGYYPPDAGADADHRAHADGQSVAAVAR